MRMPGTVMGELLKASRVGADGGGCRSGRPFPEGAGLKHGAQIPTSGESFGNFWDFLTAAASGCARVDIHPAVTPGCNCLILLTSLFPFSSPCALHCDIFTCLASSHPSASAICIHLISAPRWIISIGALLIDRSIFTLFLEAAPYHRSTSGPHSFGLKEITFPSFLDILTSAC